MRLEFPRLTSFVISYNHSHTLLEALDPVTPLFLRAASLSCCSVPDFLTFMGFPHRRLTPCCGCRCWQWVLSQPCHLLLFHEVISLSLVSPALVYHRPPNILYSGFGLSSALSLSSPLFDLVFSCNSLQTFSLWSVFTLSLSLLTQLWFLFFAILCLFFFNLKWRSNIKLFGKYDRITWLLLSTSGGDEAREE